MRARVLARLCGKAGVEVRRDDKGGRNPRAESPVHLQPHAVVRVPLQLLGAADSALRT